MKPYAKTGDEALKFPRVLGRRRMSAKLRNAAIVAKVSPKDLDDQPEEVIHDLVELELERQGWPYLSLRSRYYAWLRMMAGRGERIAAEMLNALKDVPDVVVFARGPKEGECRALPLELKTLRGKASAGQKDFAAKVGGVISHGLENSIESIRRFAK